MTSTETASSVTNFRQQQCRQQYEFYHRKFPTVPTMTSEELIERRQRNQDNNADNNEHNDILLIDVRTEPERQVSMIPGAISLDSALRMSYLPPQQPETSVVTYCTVGYRSGLEARRLIDQYPELEGRTYSLDGILMYSHVGGDLIVGGNNNAIQQTGGEQEQQRLQPATQVHTFAKMWEPCANEERYEPVFYGFPGILGRFVQVGALAVIRGSQRLGYLFLMCCCGSRRTRNDGTGKHH